MECQADCKLTEEGCERASVEECKVTELRLLVTRKFVGDNVADVVDEEQLDVVRQLDVGALGGFGDIILHLVAQRLLVLVVLRGQLELTAHLVLLVFLLSGLQAVGAEGHAEAGLAGLQLVKVVGSAHHAHPCTKQQVKIEFSALS